MSNVPKKKKKTRPDQDKGLPTKEWLKYWVLWLRMIRPEPVLGSLCPFTLWVRMISNSLKKK